MKENELRELGAKYKKEWNDYFLKKEETTTYELTSPQNRVVVPHQKASLTLLGARNNITGMELEPFLEGFPRPKSFPFSSLEEALATLETLPYSEEGYVVVDANWHRAKLKGHAYLQVHHMADNGNVSKDRVLVLIRTGEDGEMLAYFPEYTEAFEEVRGKWNAHLAVRKTLEALAEELKQGCENKKDFAMKVLQQPQKFHRYLFAMYENKVDIIKMLDDKLTYDQLF